MSDNLPAWAIEKEKEIFSQMLSSNPKHQFAIARALVAERERAEKCLLTMRKYVRILSAMNMREQILIVADQFAALRGIGRKRVSTIVLNRGSKLDDIEGGADLGTSTFEKAMAWFSANWPEGAVWPDSVARPAANPEGMAAE